MNKSTNTPKKENLEVGDKITCLVHGVITSIETISRVTNTLAYVEDNTGRIILTLKRDIPSGVLGLKPHPKAEKFSAREYKLTTPGDEVKLAIRQRRHKNLEFVKTHFLKVNNAQLEEFVKLLTKWGYGKP